MRICIQVFGVTGQAISGYNPADCAGYGINPGETAGLHGSPQRPVRSRGQPANVIATQTVLCRPFIYCRWSMNPRQTQAGGYPERPVRITLDIPNDFRRQSLVSRPRIPDTGAKPSGYAATGEAY